MGGGGYFNPPPTWNRVKVEKNEKHVHNLFKQIAMDTLKPRKLEHFEDMRLQKSAKNHIFEKDQSKK